MWIKNFFKWSLPYLAVWAGLFLFHKAWAALLGFHIAILLILFFSQPIVSPSILLKSKDFQWILFNILFCGLSGFGIYFLRPFVGLTPDFGTQMAELGLNASSMPAFIAYFSLVNPFLEEYFWRSFLGSDTKSFFIGDLLYAGYHAIILINRVSMFAVLFALACLTFMGWFWRQMKRAQNGLLASTLGHMAADFSILMAIYFIIR
jgi:hypothetical protein